MTLELIREGFSFGLVIDDVCMKKRFGALSPRRIRSLDVHSGHQIVACDMICPGVARDT